MGSDGDGSGRLTPRTFIEPHHRACGLFFGIDRHAGLIDFEILSLTQEKVMFAGGRPEVSFQQEPRPGHRTSISTNRGLSAEGLRRGGGGLSVSV